jgi:hypothetical protein
MGRKIFGFVFKWADWAELVYLRYCFSKDGRTFALTWFPSSAWELKIEAPLQLESNRIFLKFNIKQHMLLFVSKQSLGTRREKKALYQDHGKVLFLIFITRAFTFLYIVFQHFHLLEHRLHWQVQNLSRMLRHQVSDLFPGQLPREH